MIQTLYQLNLNAGCIIKDYSFPRARVEPMCREIGRRKGAVRWHYRQWVTDNQKYTRTTNVAFGPESDSG